MVKINLSIEKILNETLPIITNLQLILYVELKTSLLVIFDY